MKKMIGILAALFLTVSMASAQMGGGGMGSGMNHSNNQSMTGGAQSSGMMQHKNMEGGMMMQQQQMMMMHSMAETMTQMGEMMKGMPNGMTPDQMKDMSGVMKELSKNMGDMSDQMATGQMDPDRVQKMNERMVDVKQKMKTTATEGVKK